MNKEYIEKTIKTYLSNCLNCSPEYFEKEGTFFVENNEMWELGVDVKPEYRRKGLGAALISNLAYAVLEKDVIPFYCAFSTNISSQAVA